VLESKPVDQVLLDIITFRTALLTDALPRADGIWPLSIAAIMRRSRSRNEMASFGVNPVSPEASKSWFLRKICPSSTGSKINQS